MRIGDRVKIISIDGKTTPLKLEDNAEDYWKLIGELGTVHQDPYEQTIYAHFSQKPRVLIKFDKDLVMAFGLHSHNNIENSLWILTSDLETIRT